MPIPLRINPIGFDNREYEFGDHLSMTGKVGFTYVQTDLSADATQSSIEVIGGKETPNSCGNNKYLYGGGNSLGYGDLSWGVNVYYMLIAPAPSYSSRGQISGIENQKVYAIFNPNGWYFSDVAPDYKTFRTYPSTLGASTGTYRIAYIDYLSSNKSALRLYRCRYWTSADMTTLPYADLRPAKRKSDGWVGMYDVIRDKFFPASSKTAFELVK